MREGCRRPHRTFLSQLTAAVRRPAFDLRVARDLRGVERDNDAALPRCDPYDPVGHYRECLEGRRHDHVLSTSGFAGQLCPVLYHSALYGVGHGFAALPSGASERQGEGRVVK